VFINFKAAINVLLDFKHQRANDDAAAVIMSAFGHSKNNHGFCRVARL
jgi:hypothetical protein